MKKVLMLLLTGILILSPAGCGAVKNTVAASAGGETTTDSGAVSSSRTTLDTSDMFTSRDKEIGYEEEECIQITLIQDSAAADSDAVSISGNTVTIAEEGSYILSGSLTNGMIVVDAESSDKVQLILNGVDINCDTSAAIYVKQADKVFITLVDGTENTLSNTAEFSAIDDNNIDGVMFSKDDLTLNGTGSLDITAAYGHGIVSKDDLAVTGGTYTITAEKHALSGKNSVRIADGTFRLTSGSDGIHSSNDDDDSLGFVYIADGSFEIFSEDDGIHADTNLVIAGGNITISKSKEGVEGQGIDISGGTLNITSSDDGINATEGSSGGQSQMNNFDAAQNAFLSISGGTIYVNASGDGLDSNGDITISGGETYVSGSTNNGNGAVDYNGEAVITGGILAASGFSGMAQNFSTSSTQGSMLVTVTSQSAEAEITLKDSSGNTIVSYQPPKEYDSILISARELAEGESYSLICGSNETSVVMDSLIYGSGSGMGGKGAMNRGDQLPLDKKKSW